MWRSTKVHRPPTDPFGVLPLAGLPGLVGGTAWKAATAPDTKCGAMVSHFHVPWMCYGGSNMPEYPERIDDLLEEE